MMKKLTDNVTLLGNRHFNYFLVGQKEAAVVECGVSGGVASLAAQWKGLENPPEVAHLFALHAHFDHVCGIPGLKRLFPRAGVLASEKAGEILSKEKVMKNFFHQDRRMSETLVREGILEELPLSPETSKIRVDRTVSHGEKIPLGGGTDLEVIAAPGHSPCGLACYLGRERVMFLSDAAGFQISDQEIFPIFFQGYELYLETLRRLMGFPTEIVAIPHERLWFGEEVEAFYGRAVSSARKAFEDIRTLLDDHMEEEEIRRRLFSRYYRGNLTIYTPENIDLSIEILIRRVKECL